MRPTTEEMFFLPQRPYCTLGPLRDQITYPSSQPGGAAVVDTHGAEGEVSSAKTGTLSDGDDDELLLDLLDKVPSFYIPS